MYSGAKKADIKRKKLRLLALDALLAAAVTAAVIYENKIASLFPFCPLYRFTGLRCPSCGGTRAFQELVHLRFLRAFSYNPFLLLLGIWCAFLLIAYHLKLFAGLRLYDHISKPVMLCCITAVMLLFFVVRNLPFYPFF